MKIDWKQKLSSRKFGIAVVAGLLIIANDGLGLNLPAETIMSFAIVITGYIFGEAYIDGQRAKAQVKEDKDAN